MVVLPPIPSERIRTVSLNGSRLEEIFRDHIYANTSSDCSHITNSCVGSSKESCHKIGIQIFYFLFLRKAGISRSSVGFSSDAGVGAEPRTRRPNEDDDDGRGADEGPS